MTDEEDVSHGGRLSRRRSPRRAAVRAAGYAGAVWLIPLFACASPSVEDSAAPDSGEVDSAEPRRGPVSAPVGDSTLVVNGAPGSATGFSLAFGPDTDGDGTAAAWIAGYFTHEVCRFEGVSGTTDLLSAPTCITSAARDYPGYGLGVGPATVGLGAVGGGAQGVYTGVVYLFPANLGPGVTDTSLATTTLDGEASNDFAGTTVALWANGAGESLAVGAPGNDTNGAGAGRVYVWPDGAPAGRGPLADAPTILQGASPGAAVKHGAPEEGDGAGSVVSPAGDLDGDGLIDLVLGCNGADDGGPNAGLVAVFLAPLPAGVTALRDADAIVLGTADGAVVGDTAAGLGDVDGDGRGDLAFAGEMSLEGRTWVMPGPVASGTTADAPLSFVGEAPNDQAGAAVSPAGDADGDGLADLVVGALENNTSAAKAGAAYLVLAPFGPGSHSLADADARWLGAADGDALGRAVAGGADYDGDGLADLLLGAPYSDAGGAFGGVAYVITGR